MSNANKEAVGLILALELASLTSVRQVGKRRVRGGNSRAAIFKN